MESTGHLGFRSVILLMCSLQIFAVHGYSPCDSADHEPGHEKIAIYSRERRFKHAARQLKSGRWASKLGEEQDIEHERVEHVTNVSYGAPEDFLVRKRDDWLPQQEKRKRRTK